MNIVFAREAQEAIKKMSRWQKFQMQYRGKKICLGQEKRDGWTGELPFYLFWCRGCEHYAKDYPHGYIERQYLNCSYCGTGHDFVPWWVPWVGLWQAIKFSFKYR